MPEREGPSCNIQSYLPRERVRGLYHLLAMEKGQGLLEPEREPIPSHFLLE